MLSALPKAFGQLGDPKVNWVILVSAVLAIAALVGLWFLLHWLIVGLDLFNWSWINWMIDWLGIVAITVVTLLMFPTLVTLISSMFLEYVVRGVEQRHYAGLPAAREQPWGEIIGYLVKFTLVVIILNLVALPLYFIPFAGVIIAWVLNGYLVGREYFEMVAMRRIDLADVRSMRRAHGGKIFVAGMCVAVLMTVPVVNLVMPVVATAFFTHVYHGLRPEAASVPARA